MAVMHVKQPSTQLLEEHRMRRMELVKFKLVEHYRHFCVDDVGNDIVEPYSLFASYPVL